MKASELKEKIKLLVKQVYQDKSKIDDAAIAYDELTKFPLLKDVIVDLLTSDFDSFLEDIEWVSPRPTVFRIVLLNGQKDGLPLPQIARNIEDRYSPKFSRSSSATIARTERKSAESFANHQVGLHYAITQPDVEHVYEE